MLKKILNLVLAILLLIHNSCVFAAIVSDNDGSAFVTKSEFESLKENFAQQIENYNSSIDGKIDGAIANYLAGIRLATTTTEEFYDGLGGKALVCDTTKINDLKWGQIGFDIDATTCHMAGSSDKYYGGATYPGALTWFVMTIVRNGSDRKPFEMFRYNKDTKKLVAYSNDFECTFNITSLKIENAGWVPITSVPTSYIWRWHGGATGATSKNNVWTTDIINRGYYSTWLANPSWLQIYGSGFNSFVQGTIAATGPMDLKKTEKHVYDTDVTINKETKVTTIFDDCVSDSKTKIWTRCTSNNSSIDPTCLNSDYNTDTTQFAKNYYKTGRTLQYDLPSNNGVKFTSGKGYIVNTDGTFKNEYGSLSFSWTQYGTNQASTSTSVTSNKWYEPYFENEEEYSKNIINASTNDVLLNTFSKYGWTGKLVQGIPISEFKEDTECEFDITVPASVVLGFKTEPFEVAKLVRNTENDKNLTLYVDGTKINDAVISTVNAGTHKIKIEYNGAGVKPIFFKIGRTSSDGSNTKRYVIDLPKDYTLIQK